MPTSGPARGTGLAPNIAAVVCYLCAPITSIVIMLLEKENRDVQFHSWQATVLSIGYIVVSIALNILAIIMGKLIGFLGMVVHWFSPLVGLTAFILWLICIVKAYQGERWKIPYLGDFAEKKAGLVP
ncbi:MAG: DUF4870 domain-containing protein [Deltaproteobacteria bacterium]|nr:DUF4870 domain-containing protein [Deltaproteobacteria bacterium]